MTVERVKFAFVALFFAVLARWDSLPGRTTAAPATSPPSRSFCKRTCMNTPCASSGRTVRPPSGTCRGASRRFRRASSGTTASAPTIRLRRSAPAGGGAGPCHGAVARLYVAMVHAGRGRRVRILPRGQTQPPGFLRRYAASLPVSAFFCRGALQQQGHGAADAVLCTLWLGLRFLKQPGFLRGALFSLAGGMPPTPRSWVFLCGG